MSHHSQIALEVSRVNKQFVKSEGVRWPWKRDGNGRRIITAVDNVSFRVHRSEVFGILGPNGSGKSTLVRCISTLLVPDAGRIVVFGHDVQQEEMAVKRLINRPSHEVRREIETFFAGRKRNDLLLLYFSGHGVKDDDGRLYLTTTDTQRGLFRSTAVPATFVNETMTASRSRRQVLILDC